MSKRILLPAGILLGLLLAAGTALAAERGMGRGPGQRGPGPLQGRVVYGEIIAIDAEQLVIEPQIPERMAERLTEAGWDLPELPAELVIGIDEDTQFYRDSELATWDAFGAGDIVVIARALSDDGPGNARRVADEQTAREFLRERFGPGGPPEDGGFGPGFGPGGGRGWDGEGAGPGWGPGGDESDDSWGPGGPQRLRERMRPAFGEITALGADSVTITPEIPDFVRALMEERGVEPPADLPESVTLAIADGTRFAQDGELLEDNPFAVGDHVALMHGPDRDGEPAVWVMSDYATAEARMKEMRERFADGPPERGGKHRPRGRGHPDGSRRPRN